VKARRIGGSGPAHQKVESVLLDPLDRSPDEVSVPCPVNQEPSEQCRNED